MRGQTWTEKEDQGPEVSQYLDRIFLSVTQPLNLELISGAASCACRPRLRPRIATSTNAPRTASSRSGQDGVCPKKKQSVTHSKQPFHHSRRLLLHDLRRRRPPPHPPRRPPRGVRRRPLRPPTAPGGGRAVRRRRLRRGRRLVRVGRVELLRRGLRGGQEEQEEEVRLAQAAERRVGLSGRWANGGDGDLQD